MVLGALKAKHKGSQRKNHPKSMFQLPGLRLWGVRVKGFEVQCSLP